ncbi:MAG: amidohydrolase family protein [Candidatus Cloacimonadales bacterium]
MKLIKNVLLFDGKESVIRDLLFDNKIRKIAPEIKSESAEIIDLKGKILIPGGIDPHVHFNQPGFEHHEDFLSGTSAAAAGGITTIIDMPCTSLPPVTNLQNLQNKLQIVQPNALIDFAFWGGIRSNDLATINQQIAELWKAGVVGFKIYVTSGMASFGQLSYAQISEVLSQNPSPLFAFHAEDPAIIAQNEQQLNCSAHPEIFSQIRSIEAEFQAVQNVLKNSNNHLHFVHISSALAAASISQKKNEIDVSFETCPHYLQFTAADFPKLLGRLKTAPPVKYEADRQYLRQSLISGQLDFVATDHAGSDWETEKNLADFAAAYNGIPGTQLLLPYLLDEFYLSGKIDLPRLIEISSENAAKRYGLYPNKGSLQIGTDADFTIIDPQKPMLVDEKALLSKGKYSPLVGKKFGASIARTIVRGETIYTDSEGIVGAAGYGEFLPRN